MKLRLLFDEDVRSALAAALRKRGHAAVNALEKCYDRIIEGKMMFFFGK